MITITFKRELHTQTAKYVYVQREKALYVQEDGWIRKQYFSIREAQTILQMEYFTLHRMLVSLGMRSAFNGNRPIKISLRQLMKISEIIEKGMLTKE